MTTEMYEASTDMVDLEVLENGDLKLSLRNDKDARQEWLHLYAATYYDHTYAQDDAWLMLMEDLGANSEYELFPELDYHHIGALTSAPVIAWCVDRDEKGGFEGVERIWWFPNYAIEDFVLTLFETGEVIFTNATNEGMDEDEPAALIQAVDHSVDNERYR